MHQYLKTILNPPPRRRRGVYDFAGLKEPGDHIELPCDSDLAARRIRNAAHNHAAKYGWKIITVRTETGIWIGRER